MKILRSCCVVFLYFFEFIILKNFFFWSSSIMIRFIEKANWISENSAILIAFVFLIFLKSSIRFRFCSNWLSSICKFAYIENSKFERALADATNAALIVIIVLIYVSNHCFYFQTSVFCNHIVWFVITLIIRFATKNNRHVVRIRDDFYFDFKSSIIIINNVLFIRFFFIIEHFDHAESIALFWFVAFFEQTA